MIYTEGIRKQTKHKIIHIFSHSEKVTFSEITTENFLNVKIRFK